MLKMIALIFAVIMIALSLLILFYFRKKCREQDPKRERSYKLMLRKAMQYVKSEAKPIVVITVLFFAFLLWQQGRNMAVYYLAGSFVTAFLAVFTTLAAPFIARVTADAEEEGEQETTRRVSLGSASIALMGVGCAIVVIVSLYRIYSFASVTSCLAAFTLGSSVIALFVRVKSGVYTKLLDLISSFVCVLSAAIMLSETAVLESGVNVLFTSHMAAVYPIFYMGVGFLVGSILLLMNRSTNASQAAGFMMRSVYLTITVMTLAGIFFSYRFLGSIDYCVPMIAGGACAALTGRSAEIRRRSVDRYVRAVRQHGSSATLARDPFVRSLRAGMMSTLIPVFCIAAAIYASYYFAGFYGIALLALAASSTIVLQLAAAIIPLIYRNAHIIRAAAGQKTEDAYLAFETPSGDILNMGDGLAILEASLSAVVLYNVYTRLGVFAAIDVSDPIVILALLLGVLMPFGFLAGSLGDPGMAHLHMKRRMIPGFLVILLSLVIGYLFGPEVLGGVIVGAVSAGTLVSFVAANSGAGVRSNSESVIDTLIKLMPSLALTFLPLLVYNILA